MNLNRNPGSAVGGGRSLKMIRNGQRLACVIKRTVYLYICVAW
jgi:hypothetical protein